MYFNFLVPQLHGGSPEYIFISPHGQTLMSSCVMWCPGAS